MARHRNFNIVSADMTRTNRFKPSFYRETDMQAEFQKQIEYKLFGLENAFYFLKDILIVSRGNFKDHINLVKRCPKQIRWAEPAK